MFRKKECKSCGESIENNHKFCPYCGELSSKKSPKNDGMLGEDDTIEEFNGLANSMFGNTGMKMFESAMKMMNKMIEKEMQKEVKKHENIPKADYQLFINGKRIEPKKVQRQKKQSKELPANYLRDFAVLEKREPKTNIRRFSDKVIYEIQIPGVKSLEDLSLVKLENSIELKAVAKNKAYHKIIPITLPVMDYEFSDGKLILELDSKE